MDERKDIFDKLMGLPVLRKAKPFYSRHREVLLYLFFGGLAFLVNIGTFWLFHDVVRLHELVANVISWIITVLLAFFTNRVWVFAADSRTADAFWRQMAAFFVGRALTLAVEELMLFLFVTRLELPGTPVKLPVQILVIVLNYFLSKYWIFKSEPAQFTAERK